MAKATAAKKNEAPVAPAKAAPKSAKKSKLDPKEMLSLVVAHGSLKQNGELLGVGSPVSMTRAEKLHLDPDDITLVTEAKWKAIQSKAEAEEVLAGDNDAPAESDAAEEG